MADRQGRDFFISYTGVNRAWAEWIAVQLEAAGHSTVLQAWDFRPGSDFIHQMQQATTSAGRTIAVLSPAYFGSEFGEAEWRAVFVKDPTGEKGLLVPVRVQPCQPPGLLASRVYVDLVDADEATAKRLLLAGVGEAGARPTSAPFPGTARGAKRFPGQGPAVSNLPAMPAAASGGVFISYRRQESSGLAGRLYDRLAARFGDDQVFMDVDTIALGVDFAEVITQAVSTCQVLLAVIGPRWLTATDEEGQRRLEDLDDIVRLEIAAALERDIRVIPILVEGAQMPRRQELPDALARLARRNALSVRHESFRSDADRLVAAIEPILHAAAAARRDLR